MSSMHSYCGDIKPKTFAKREQTIVYQRGENFSSHEREQKSSSFARKNFLRTNANKNFRHWLEKNLLAKKIGEYERYSNAKIFLRAKSIV